MPNMCSVSVAEFGKTTKYPASLRTHFRGAVHPVAYFPKMEG